MRAGGRPVTLTLAGDELLHGLGYFHAKPATAFSPVFITPDALGDAWRDARLHLRLHSSVNGKLYGQPDAGVDVKFDFADLIVAAAQTRSLGAGTIVGSGAVANRHDDALPLKRDGIGFSSIAEARTQDDGPGHSCTLLRQPRGGRECPRAGCRR